MKALAEEQKSLIPTYFSRFESLTEEDWRQKTAPDKWSKKEILGHLVDSALNNIQRYVRGQFESGVHIIYYQDDWVKAANYQNYPTAELLQLWKLLNDHICILWKNMPESAYLHSLNFSKDAPAALTMLEAAQDYVSHLLHHIEQMKLQP